MNQPSIRNLRSDDAIALLEFELANRRWFESNIEARDPAFYSPAGVAEHIATLLGEFDAGTSHPCLLLAEDGRIVGRANLKNIDTAGGSAEVGYRIGEQETGKGLATLALRHLVELARTHWGLHRLDAFVIDANAASAKVLLKRGFKAMEPMPALARMAGAMVDGRRYELSIPLD